MRKGKLGPGKSASEDPFDRGGWVKTCLDGAQVDRALFINGLPFEDVVDATDNDFAGYH